MNDRDIVRKLAEALGGEDLGDWCPDHCSCGIQCGRRSGHGGECCCIVHGP